MKVYFYPHEYMRDRQLDTIKRWPMNKVINLDILDGRVGNQVSKNNSISKKTKVSWKQILPLLNIKFRPTSLKNEDIVYLWGGIMLTGKYIVDVDNPWSFVAYNMRAMFIYRYLIKYALLSDRCVEIRCLSEACRQSIKYLFGDEVYRKSKVQYPYIKQKLDKVQNPNIDKCRFLFVGTQFEIKGGGALLNAFSKIYSKYNNCTLDLITHLPPTYQQAVDECNGINLYNAEFTREEIHEKFMKNSDVLLFPTYGESFGMVALEALSFGLAIIATDVYALREIVEDGVNGALIQPPISTWDGVIPSKYQYDWVNYKKYINLVDTKDFEQSLEIAMKDFIEDQEWLLRAKNESLNILEKRFAC
ncbi:MAG: glycosyltransferase family 4 protein [Gammaproteobacteria bacterium]|nr:glycosyltransferase family 4 protein [Gammaproteobacteria bacterium]